MKEEKCVVSIMETSQVIKSYIIDILYAQDSKTLTGNHILQLSGAFIIGKNELGIFEGALTDLIMGRLVKEYGDIEDDIEELCFWLTPFGEQKYHDFHKYDF